MDLPQKVKEEIDDEIDNYEEYRCSTCNNRVYSVSGNIGNYLYDEFGKDAFSLEDSSVTPRHVNPDGREYMCGSCSEDTTYFERGLQIFAADTNGNVYAALSQDDVIMDHYITDDHFDNSEFSEAFEAIVRNEKTITLEDGTEMVEVDDDNLPMSRNEIREKLKNKENPLDCRVISAGRYSMYIEDL